LSRFIDIVRHHWLLPASVVSQIRYTLTKPISPRGSNETSVTSYMTYISRRLLEQQISCNVVNCHK